MYNVVPTIQVRSKSIMLYDQYENVTRSAEKSELRISNMRHQRKERYAGKMTKGARRRLRKAIDIMVQSIKPQWIWNEVSGRPHLHRLSFITLTISSEKELLSASDAYKRLLRPFLQWLTKYKNVKLYIWKAELQKRGQIHYHITTPTFVQYDQIRKKWNELQKKEGLLNGYYEKKHHYDPNSTDVHEVYRIKDVAAYLMKYLSKEIDTAIRSESGKETDNNSISGEKRAKKGTTSGKVWDCSLSLKKAKYYTCESSTVTEKVIKKYLKSQKIELYNADRCTVIKAIGCKPIDLLSKHEQELYYLHMKAIREGYSDSVEEKVEKGAMPDTSVKQEKSRGKTAVKQGILQFEEYEYKIYQPIAKVCKTRDGT